MGFKSIPSIGGFGTEWVNGETRLVKDNSAGGSGDIFGFVWTDSGPMTLIVSTDNGLTWSSVASRSTSINKVIALTQDSTGAVHLIAYANVSDSGYYLRVSLTYTNKHISGFAFATSSPVQLPNHNRVGTELRADIKMIRDNSGAEVLAYAINMPTINIFPVRDIKVYMARAKSLSPAAASDFVGIDGTGLDTKVFDSCSFPGACNNTTGFSTHLHTALFAQNGTSRDLYLFQGPIDGDYGALYNDTSTNVLYVTRLTMGTGQWMPGTAVAVSSNTHNNVSPELMSVASGSSYAWVMYVDPINGIRFGRIDATGSYNENVVASPYPVQDRNGWGVFTISADDTRVWAIWDTLDKAGGTANAAEGYWDGNSWVVFNDATASNSMGMATTSGWTTGVGALLFNGNVQSQTYLQPTAATIWTNP